MTIEKKNAHLTKKMFAPKESGDCNEKTSNIHTPNKKQFVLLIVGNWFLMREAHTQNTTKTFGKAISTPEQTIKTFV